MVHESWRVAQRATETRKVSYAVSAHRSGGRGQEGDRFVGSVDRGAREVKSARYMCV